MTVAVQNFDSRGGHLYSEAQATPTFYGPQNVNGGAWIYERSEEILFYV